MCWATNAIDWRADRGGIEGLRNFPLWRVPKATAQKLEFRDYISAFLVAIFGIPTLSTIGLFTCYILTETVFARTQSPSVIVFLMYLSIMGAASILLVWIFLIITIPIFYLAKHYGYFGFLPTNLVALLLLFVFWVLMYDARDEADLLVIYSIIICLLYANVVWFRCRQITPEAFQTEIVST